MILVTGAAGFLGRRVVRVLRERGHPVRGLLRSRGRAALVEGPGGEVALGEVTDPGTLDAAMDGVTGVVHLVAIIRERGELTFEAVNREGTGNVVEAARRYGVERLVHLSAIGAQDNPRYPYLRSKWQGERSVMEGGVPFTILRPSILFGEGDEFVNSLAAVVRALPVAVVLGDGSVRFQPMAADDVAEGVARTLDDSSTIGEVLELGGPEEMTYNQLMDTVCRRMGVRRPRLHLPPRLLRPAVAVAERVLSRPPITGHQLDMVALDNVPQENAAPRLLGRPPQALADGIDYVRSMSFVQAWRVLLGFMPAAIRDH